VNGGNAALTAANGFTNFGEIRLDTATSEGYSSTLVVSSGTLTNAASGTINANNAVGPRTITADLNNLGTVNINVSTTFNKTSGTITNQNNFNIAAGAILTLPTGPTLTFNQSAGVLTVAATGAFNINSVVSSLITTATFNLNGGTCNVSGSLTVSSSGTFNLNGGTLHGSHL